MKPLPSIATSSVLPVWCSSPCDSSRDVLTSRVPRPISVALGAIVPLPVGVPAARTCLVHEIGELGAAFLEAVGRDVRDVVGGDVQLGLLGFHAGGCGGE